MKPGSTNRNLLFLYKSYKLLQILVKTRIEFRSPSRHPHILYNVSIVASLLESFQTDSDFHLPPTIGSFRMQKSQHTVLC
jgi:hypothetical protein